MSSSAAKPISCFFRAEIPDLALRLRQRGILIRDCGNYYGLSDGYYRIAVRTHEENEMLAEALKQAAAE